MLQKIYSLQQNAFFENALLCFVLCYPVAIIFIPLSLGSILPLSLFGIWVLFAEKPYWKPLEKMWLCSVVTMLVYVLLLIFFTENHTDTLSRLGYFFRYLFIFPLYFLLKKYPNHLPIIFQISIIIAGLCLPFSQYELSLQGRGTTNLSPIWYGYLSVLVFSFSSLFLLYNNNSKIIKAGLLLAGLGALTASFLSGTRGIVPTLLIVLGIIFITEVHKKKFKRLFFLVFSFFCITALIVVNIPEKHLSRFTQAPNNIIKFIKQNKLADNKEAYSSSAYRLKQWEVSFKLWQAKPWFGYGIGNFDDTFRNYQKKENIQMFSKKNAGLSHPHSIYFFLLVSSGLVGLLLTLTCLLIMPAIIALKTTTHNENYQVYKYMTITLILLFAGFGIAESWILRSFVAVYLFFLALFLAILQNQSSVHSHQN